MYIAYLKSRPNRAHADQVMAEHVQWIQQGPDEGFFLMTRSLDRGQGGVVLTANREFAEIQKRTDLDPFVIHGMVSAEIHAVTPSRMAPAMAALLDGAQSSSSTS